MINVLTTMRKSAISPKHLPGSPCGARRQQPRILSFPEIATQTPGGFANRGSLVETEFRLLEVSLPIFQGELPLLFARKLFYSLRPYGGAACLAMPADSYEEFAGWVAAAQLPNAEVKRAGEFTVLTREGALPGSGDWTHQYGDAANTGVSKDSLVRAPLGLLWFGGSSNVTILPRHGHGPPEHVVDGRLFIEGPESMRAMDVYRLSFSCAHATWAPARKAFHER